MSLVADKIRHIDGQLDRITLSTSYQVSAADTESSPEIERLQLAIKTLSAASSNSSVLSSWRLSLLLKQAKLGTDVEIQSLERSELSTYHQDLQWLFISKVALQTYGLVLQSLFDTVNPLSEDVWYFDDVLSSYSYTSLYIIQTAPWRFTQWAKETLHETRHQLSNMRNEGLTIESDSIKDTWRTYWHLVQKTIQERSLANVQSRVLTPLNLARRELRRNQKKVAKLRELNASGLGILIDVGLGLKGHASTESYSAENVEDDEPHDGSDLSSWKTTMIKSINLMHSVLRSATDLSIKDDFDELVFDSVHSSDLSEAGPQPVGQLLQELLENTLPGHTASTSQITALHGRPSRLVRYWPAATVLLLGSTTILRFVTNRRAEIIQWIQDLGQTTRDFWYNWVIEPLKRVVATIRHDKDSDIALMSRESLAGDRASLERMVVDFAVDHPEDVNGTALTETEKAQIQAKVAEGDLTPVLRAYERDLKKPFQGAIRGDLVRALLIQVQKTKVDVEVALGGIDSLLKSQELVFGFIGLTPGILVTVAAARWLSSTFGSRRGRIYGSKAGRLIRVLRGIDRILTTAQTDETGVFGYKDFGFLLCQTQLLRQYGRDVLPTEILREWTIDVADLEDIHQGVHVQRRVLDRLRWAYAKWLGSERA